MRFRLPLAPVLTLTLALATGCGSDKGEQVTGGGSAATSTPTSTATPTATPAADPEREIRRVFADYNATIRDRRFAAGCLYLAPETVEKLRANLRKLTGSAPEGCEASLTVLYAQILKSSKAERTLDATIRTARIEDVKVTGDAAIIDWSTAPTGKREPISQSARRIDGEWKLVDVTN